MKAYKWNFITREYEPYEMPADWKCLLYCKDLSQLVNCAGCGKKMKYNDGYTSVKIHNWTGFGYIVCPECHDKEWAERKASAEKEKI